MSVRDLVAQFKMNNLKRKMEPSFFEFPKAIRSPKHILVCLPGELRELTLVKQFLPGITDLFKPASITLLTMPGLKITDIFPHKGFNILAPTVDQLTWSGMAKKSYLEFLQKEGFDLLLDLNLSSSMFTSSILLSFPNAIRVGRGNHLGQPFYNLEIKTRYLRDELNIYRSLIDTLKILKEGNKQSADSHQK
ncbi:MAG: hypothetical protein ABIJ12_05740 [bacterium]